MQFTSLVFNLLPNAFWSITPAQPKSAPGARLRVGTPEMIPDFAFVVRELVSTDGFSSSDRLQMNEFIEQGRVFDAMYGFDPVTINCFNDVLAWVEGPGSPIGRIRIISHGSTSGLFLPMFDSGGWDLQEDWLRALQVSDEGGIRYLISKDAARSPLLPDSVVMITRGIRARNGAVLAPFGLEAAGVASDIWREYFEIVNDLYQVPHGTLVVDATLLTAAQRETLTASLNLVEPAVRARIVGTTPPNAAGPLTDEQVRAFRDAVLAATPAQLALMGPQRNLAATVVADIEAALNAVPRVANAIKIAIVGVADELVLSANYLDSMVLGLQTFVPTLLTLGGVTHDYAMILEDEQLEAFILSAIDLHHLQNVDVLVDGAPSTAAQRAAIRDGLLAISDILRTEISGRAVNPIPGGPLTLLRAAIETRPLRESAITGGVFSATAEMLGELAAAATAMQGGFRARLENVRGRMQPENASAIDIRGCLVGANPAFLNVLRDFMGGAANKPTVSAPEWFQSFPTAGTAGAADVGLAFPAIDAFLVNGHGVVAGADVVASLTEWCALIDFDPHVDFISALFAVGARQRDFAALDWRAWRTAAFPTGIPVLRMEAARVDDLTGLDLGQLIERFRQIFEIDSAHAPNAAARARLIQLQPHVAAFKVADAAITAAAPGPPTQPQLDGFLVTLSALAVAVAGVPGFPAPVAPLVPPAAPPSLADIQGFATRIRDHLDTILAANLDAFFAAVQGRLDHANAAARYFFNIGLPLLVQRRAPPPVDSVLAFFISAPTDAVASAVRTAAIRSWMRIQFSGTAAQAAKMNGTIDAVPVATPTQRRDAAQRSMLSDWDVVEATDAAVSPTPKFAAHIKSRP